MNDLKMGLKLFKFSPMKKSTLFSAAVIFGLAVVYMLMGTDNMFVFSSMFISCVAFFFIQLLQYNCYFSIVLVSEKKERIMKHVIPNCSIVLETIGLLVTCVLLALSVKVGKMPESSISGCLIIAGVFAGTLLVYAVLAFRLAMIAYIFYIGSLGVFLAFMNEIIKTTSELPIPAAIGIGVGIYVAGAIASKLVAKAVYCIPYSPYAGKMMLQKEAKNI